MQLVYYNEYYCIMEIVCLRILIAGDSFAAEWPGTHGWSKMLAEHHDVKNVAQAGVSEYKILKQLKNFLKSKVLKK